MSTDKPDPLVCDYFDEWLDRRRAHMRPSTVNSYRGTIARYIKPQLGSNQLSQLDRRLLESFYADLLAAGGLGGKPLSPRTIERVHTIIRGGLQDALVDGLIDEDPTKTVTPPRRDPYATEVEDKTHAWTAAQVARFLAVVDDHPWRALWHLAVGTGARRSELLGLRWEDVNLDAATVTISCSLTVVEGVARLHGTKNSRRRRLSIAASVVDALTRHQLEQAESRRVAGANWNNTWDLVFTQPDGTNVNPGSVTNEFGHLVRRHDVPVVRLHDLRHTHASLLLEQGESMKLISERLGHASITITMDTYAHLMPAMDHDAAVAMEEAIHGPDG